MDPRGDVATALRGAMRAVEAGAPVAEVLEELQEELAEIMKPPPKQRKEPDGKP